jgi:hypothetical protein
MELTGLPKKMLFANAMWDETARIHTVSPAGQMEAAEDDILPAVPEINMFEKYIRQGAVSHCICR